jgi:hypothetical protein
VADHTTSSNVRRSTILVLVGLRSSVNIVNIPAMVKTRVQYGTIKKGARSEKGIDHGEGRSNDVIHQMGQ